MTAEREGEEATLSAGKGDLVMSLKSGNPAASSINWVVVLVVALGAVPLADKQLDALFDKFDELDWAVAQLPDGYLSVSGTIEGNEPLAAASQIVETSKKILDDIGLDGAQLARISILSEESREREELASAMPELLAATDIGKVLGVSRQRVSQLYKDHPQFPAPVAHTGAGPLWTRSAVDWFVSVWDRRPGRRSEGPDEVKSRPLVTKSLLINGHAAC